MIPFKKSFFHFYRRTLKAALRFPFMTMSALMAFVFILFYNHFYTYFPLLRTKWLFITFECILGIPMFFSISIASQFYKLDAGKRYGMALVAICILGMHYFALPNWAINIDATYFMRFFIFLVILLLLASVIIFLKEVEQMAFWQYNQFLLTQFFLSTVLSLALFVGLAGATFLIETLFDLQLSSIIYIDLLVFCLVFVNTLFFNASIPQDLEYFSFVTEYKSALKLFVRYVLMPIIAVYLLIFILYFGKIVLETKLPKGMVCFPIIIFSLLGLLSYFLIFPIQQHRNNGIISFFWKYFFYILFPFIILYSLALFLRIHQYGLSEWRYLGILYGLWLLISILYSWLASRPRLLFYPFVLLCLLLLGSVGPWGMFQLSAQSQYKRLKKILTVQNVLENKEVDVAKAKNNLNDSLKNEIVSICKFLFYREEISLVYPILAENEKKKIDKIIREENKRMAFNDFLQNTFHIEEKQFIDEIQNVHINFIEGNEISIEGYKRMQYFENYTIEKNSIEINKQVFPLDSFLQTLYKAMLENKDYGIDQEYYFTEMQSSNLFLINKDGYKISFSMLEFILNEEHEVNLQKANFYYLTP